MDTNRTLFKACIASLALLLASGVSAQTIYKQVDNEGRITFTDRPNPDARVVTSFEPMRRQAREQASDPAQNPAPAEARATSDTSLPRTAVLSAGATPARSHYGDAERAAATYTPLNTPLAAQADATEAARRARQEATRGPAAAPVLVVRAAPREHEAASKPGVDAFYILWVVTFFLLAAGLLYVGWQVFRLILGTAFPRWQVGVA